MSRFKNKERVQIIAPGSTYVHQYGTVIETENSSVKVLVDDVERALRFWETEVIAAPHVPAPAKKLPETRKYIRELDEDTKLLFDAAGLFPQGTSVQKDMQAYAKHQAAIIRNLKVTLANDGVNLWEDENGGE
jgi:hypothetical protein